MIFSSSILTAVGSRANQRRGAAAERVVGDYYFAQGFSLLATNQRFGPLELDLIVRKDTLVIIVEVRTRRPGALVGPFASVTAPKRRRLKRARDLLWRSLASDKTITRFRVDVAAVDLWSCPVVVDIASAIAL